MNLVIRIVVAILCGVIVTGLLDYFGLLTPHLNTLIGILVAILVFWQYDGTLPARRV